MEKIKVVRNKADLINKEQLISLILEQMDTIGSSSDYNHINRAVENALADSNHSIFFLYILNNNIVAFAFGNICAGLESGADYIWINELFVSPNFRKRNIASEMLIFIEKWSKSQNIKYMACITGEKNTPAQELYKKNGFEINLTNWVDKSIE